MADNLFAPERLKDKIGKLPVWAWGVIGATVILLGYYISRSRRNARAVNVTANPSANSANPLSAFFGLSTPQDTIDALLPSGTSGVSNGGGAEVSGSGDTSTSIDTNLSWLNKGIAIAVQKGNHTPLGSTTALQKYLNGLPLNVYEQDVVGIALNNLGYPPEGAPVLVKEIKNVVGKSDAVNPTPVVKPTKAVTPVVTTKVVTPIVKPTKTVTPVVTSTKVVTPVTKIGNGVTARDIIDAQGNSNLVKAPAGTSVWGYQAPTIPASPTH